MTKSFLGLVALSASTPALMGATGLPLPAGMPDWLPWALSVASPAALFVLHSAGKVIAAYLRAKAKQLKEDKDPANDAEGETLNAVADVFDKVAEKKGE